MKKSEQYDIAVIGLGAMGSAALYHLSQMGVRVIGIDQYNPPHTFGSTHGDTRITRLAIGEGSEYVPLVTRAHSLWRPVKSWKRLALKYPGLIIKVLNSQVNI